MPVRRNGARTSGYEFLPGVGQAPNYAAALNSMV